MIVETEAILDACPFCGQPGILRSNNDGKISSPQFWVKCATQGCGASPAARPSDTEAIERWNRRA